jgi:hypothetical protein
LRPWPGHSASGAYQYLPATWRQWTKASGIGGEYPQAYLAPANIQDAVTAFALLHGRGANDRSLWYESGPKMGHRYENFGNIDVTPEGLAKGANLSSKSAGAKSLMFIVTPEGLAKGASLPSKSAGAKSLMFIGAHGEFAIPGTTMLIDAEGNVRGGNEHWGHDPRAADYAMQRITGGFDKSSPWHGGGVRHVVHHHVAHGARDLGGGAHRALPYGNASCGLDGHGGNLFSSLGRAIPGPLGAIFGALGHIIGGPMSTHQWQGATPHGRMGMRIENNIGADLAIAAAQIAH